MFNWKNSSARKADHIKTLLCLALTVAAVSAAVLCAPHADAMYVEGTYVVASGDAEEAERAVPVVNDKLLDIYGRITGALIPDAAEDAVGSVQQLQENEYMWHITVDGKIVAAGEKDVLYEMLEEVLTDGVDDSGTYASFVQNVSIDLGFVPADTLRDIEAIEELLFGENGLLDVKVTKIEYELIDIPYEVTEQESDKYYDFQTGAVVVPGVLGEMRRFTEIVKINGETVSEKMKETVLSRPSNSVVAIGTKEYSEASFGEYIWPATGTITSRFGPRSGGTGSSNHMGLDIAGWCGQPIRAADSGEVIYADWMNGFGNLVKVRHDNGDVTYYAHCSAIEVRKGERVCQGEIIAKMGSTGVSSGNHLHFEVYVGGTDNTDPETLLPDRMY